MTPQSQLEKKLRDHLLYGPSHRSPSPGEVRSWNASIPTLAADLVDAGLGDVEVILEHQMPYSSQRSDAILAGHHPETGEPSYVVIELKQWTSAALWEDDPTLVKVAPYPDPVLHPSLQVDTYRDYIADFTRAIRTPESVTAAAYLHNARRADVAALFAGNHGAASPVFTASDKAEFHAYLRGRLQPDAGTFAADMLLNSALAPSKVLLAHAGDEIKKRDQFVLLDEQRVAYQLVLHEVEEARRADSKEVVIVTGGPGTGKSVIALSALAELADQGRSVLHATGSKSFTETMRKVAGKGSTRIKSLFKYFNGFITAERNGLDALILDEAHRIREKSVDRFTRKEIRAKAGYQVDELIDAARVSVFLLDEHQVVRGNEIGTVEAIEKAAAVRGIGVRRITLDDQFRCGGSEKYMDWVLGFLSLGDADPMRWAGDGRYELRVAESPEQLEEMLEVKRQEGYTARLSAGFCWPWSDMQEDGTLVDDVQIGSWSKPWNAKAKNDRKIGDVPPSHLWASDPDGFGQVGCIYTAQGFEYDWSGVIIGDDLVWRTDRWVAQRSASKDPAHQGRNAVSDVDFERLIKNVYKVLLTRGLAGTYVYSTDPETQEHLHDLVPASEVSSVGASA